MKKISIIIPAYNVGKHIRRSILSIVSQNVSTDNYELIVVNDGSTDDTQEVLKDLKEQYPFIHVIDKKNGGAASARNEGLKHFSGDYVFFLDSDDWISEDSLAFFLKWIEDYPVDILMFGVCEIYDNGKIVPLTSNLAPNDLVLPVEDYMVNYTLRSSSCMSLFHKDIFHKYNVRLREGFMTEDDDLIVKTFSVSKEVVCNNKIVYYYYQRAESVSNSFDYAHTEKLIQDKTRLLIDLVEYAKRFHGKMRQGIERKLDFLSIDIIRLLIRKDHSSNMIEQVLDELRSVNLYPLRKASYSTKYKLFRFVFNSPSWIKFARCFKKFI